ncbi:MAG TPA: hypothetical protein VF796_02165 [Humisphaera sp.]
MTTRARDTEQVIRALQSIMLPARIERTCVRCAVAVDAESRDTLIYSEDWLSQEDVDRQIRSPRFAQVLVIMEMADRPPTLEFEFVSQTRGLEYAESVKLAGGGRAAR